MNKASKIYIAGHTGLVGSAILRALENKGYLNILIKSHKDLDLTNQKVTLDFFKKEKPDYVFLAAAKVGGIKANSFYPADFIYNNLAIQTNIIHSSYLNDVKRLLFLGSSCIYPKFSDQPIKESYLLSGYLEPTNQAYALSKIAGIEMCASYNKQYKTEYLSAMPTNVYGPGDRYDENDSHVIPALIKKFHEAKVKKRSSVTLWGSGKAFREFIYCDDLASACVFLMDLNREKFNDLLNLSNNSPIVNIGSGIDLTIKELAIKISKIVEYSGEIFFDSTMPDGTPKKLLDITKMNNLGWKTAIKFDVGLKLTYQSYLRALKG